MKTLIVYLSRHGCAEKAANLLTEQLNQGASVINLKDEKNPDISEYSSIIIGGSIHAGQVQDGIKKFYMKNMDRLLDVKLGLYLCCMETGDTAWKQFYDAFPEELRNHATATGIFGGEFNFDKMSSFDKKIVEKVANVTESVSMMKIEAIEEFARKFKD